MRESLRKKEQREAIEKLRELVKPGDTVYTILRHVSRSGMSRVIDAVIQTEDGPMNIGWLFARAAGLRFDPDHGGVVMDGCGMDMGCSLVYEASRRIWPSGFGCPGESCRSNDHGNGDRSYIAHGALIGRIQADAENREDCVRHWHRDGGYAIKHQWL